MQSVIALKAPLEHEVPCPVMILQMGQSEVGPQAQQLLNTAYLQPDPEQHQRGHSHTLLQICLSCSQHTHQLPGSARNVAMMRTLQR